MKILKKAHDVATDPNFCRNGLVKWFSPMEDDLGKKLIS
jgi:hypothetical protein